MAATVDPARLPQAGRVILVRHARPRVRLDRPSAEWELSEEGHTAAHRLSALALFEHATSLYAGPEPKMAATLAPLAAERGLTVATDPAFAESVAGGWLGDAQFLAAVGRFLTTPGEAAAPGWETAGQAVSRFAVGVERLRLQHGPVVRPGHVNPGTFAIASGGRVLTAYLAALLGYSPETAFQVWRRMRMPDIAVVELAPGVAPRLVIPFGALTPSAGALAV